MCGSFFRTFLMISRHGGIFCGIWGTITSLKMSVYMGEWDRARGLWRISNMPCEGMGLRSGLRPSRRSLRCWGFTPNPTGRCPDPRGVSPLDPTGGYYPPDPKKGFVQTLPGVAFPYFSLPLHPFLPSQNYNNNAKFSLHFYADKNNSCSFTTF